MQLLSVLVMIFVILLFKICFVPFSFLLDEEMHFAFFLFQKYHNNFFSHYILCMG